MRAPTILSVLGAAGFQLGRGRRYIVHFRLPETRSQLSTSELDAFRAIMPPGAELTPAMASLFVQFVAPTDGELAPVTTPLGTFDILAMAELAQG